MGKRIVIVGGVAGGASAAARARRMDESATITLFERSEFISFASCGLPYYVGGEIAQRDKLLIVTPQQFKRRFNVDARVGCEVVRIDRKAKLVEVRRLADGSSFTQPYDVLILAPGAAPIRPPIPGIDAPGVFTLRAIPDADRIAEFAARDRVASVAVVGGGYIGLEMAENLRRLDLDVAVVEMLDQVMAPIDREMAEFVHQHVAHHGVDLRLGRKVVAFEPAADGRIRVKTDRVSDTFSRSGEKVSDTPASPAADKPLEVDMVVLSIGVRPEVKLAADAGLALGERGGIAVDDHLRTSDPNIFAVGDAVEIPAGRGLIKGLVPLAGPANKQGRTAADNATGGEVTYPGTTGTSIVRVFDLTVAATGANEKALQRAGEPFVKLYLHSASHAGYFPGAMPLAIKVLMAPGDGRLLGAQIVGVEGVDKRIDVLATAMWAGLAAPKLAELDLAYAPPYGSAKDAINMVGFIAENVLAGVVDLCQPQDLADAATAGATVLDVRTEGEWNAGHCSFARHIPVDDLRGRLAEVPRDKPVVCYCGSGLRSYIACRILTQSGYKAANVPGGWITYCAVHPESGNRIPGLKNWSRRLALQTFYEAAAPKKS